MDVKSWLSKKAMKTKTRKTPLMMTTVFDLTCCPSPFVPESELSHNVEAHHGLVPKLGHHEWKNPASLKNHSFQYIAVMSGCAAGFLGFSSEDVFSCAATSDVVRACAGACSQAQSHDSSTGLEELKHQQRGFQGFC
jgi:hypothetical protein